MNNAKKNSKSPLHSSIAALLIIAILIAFDQMTKVIAVKGLSGGKHVPLIPGVLELTLVQNRGAAFGILQDARIFFFFITAAALCVIGYFLLHVPDTRHYMPLRLCLYFIAGGAAGNFIDRIVLTYVRDFIYFCLIDFPVFNVADIYITCSAFILVFLTIFYYKDDRDFDFLKKENKTESGPGL
jgi:signal peptidase II